MRKTFLKVSLLAVLGLGMSASFTSCKDYDSEIDNIQSQLDQLKSKVTEIENLVKGGSVITGVTQAADGGVTFTMSDGKTVTIPAGKNGKDADVWTIVKNAEGAYYWAKNGEITEFPAQGPAGVAEPGICYVPNEDGFFYEYNPATGESKKTDIEWRSKGGNLSAVATEDKVILTGVVDADGKPADDITIWRSMFVKSLVVKPELYLDGIEATRYEVAKTNRTLDVKTVGAGGQTVAPYTDAPKGATIAAGQPTKYQFAVANNNFVTWRYNEVAKLDYAINPDKAVVEGMDWNLIFDDIEVVNRSSNVNGKVQGTPEKDGNGNVTITYQLGNTQYLAPYENGKDGVPSWVASNSDWTMMALQVMNPQNDSTLVTSNNVLVLKKTVTPVHLLVSEAEVNASGAEYYHTADCAEAGIQNVANDDDDLENPSAATVYPEGYTTKYTSPAPILEIAYNEVYNLAKHISIEAATFTPMIDGNAKDKEDEDSPKDNTQTSDAANWDTEVITLEEAAKKYNLTASFKAVTYTVKPNSTSEDMFAIVSEDGKITPCWVTESGQSVAIPGTDKGRSAIGRMPLVYVTLTAEDGKVILAGFVKVVYGEPERVEPGVTLASKTVPYICEYTMSSNWEQITALVYEKFGVTPTEFAESYEMVAGEMYEDVNGEIMLVQDAFKAAYGNNAPNNYVLGEFKWDTENPDGSHTQKLTLIIDKDNYVNWYPYKNGAGVWVCGNVTAESRNKVLYAKFRNEKTNTTLFIGFDVTLVGAPAADYEGKLFSSWSQNYTVAPINPAVPGQTGAIDNSKLAYAQVMGMNFRSAWKGGNPIPTAQDPYNWSNNQAPYLLGKYTAHYSFNATQDNVIGASGAEYKVTTAMMLNSRERDTHALYALKKNDDGTWPANKIENWQPIAAITATEATANEVAKGGAFYPGQTNTVGFPGGVWNRIDMLSVYWKANDENSSMKWVITPAYNGNNELAYGDWTYAAYACDIVNAEQFDFSNPAVLFNVDMQVTYTQLTNTTDNCTLTIPGYHDFKVGVGRPIALNNANTATLKDAQKSTVLGSQLFNLVDWQGKLLWNTSKNGTVTANTSNGVSNLDFWMSKDKFSAVQWPNLLANGKEVPEYQKQGSLRINLAKAMVGQKPNVEEAEGYFADLYVDKQLTITTEGTTNGRVDIVDNVARVFDATDLSKVVITWTNDGNSVTNDIYVFVPVYVNYIWGQDMFLGYATITIQTTLQGK